MFVAATLSIPATGFSTVALPGAEMDELPRREHGQRRYNSEVIGRLSFIGVAQQAGLNLAEIKRLTSDIDGHRLGRPDPLGDAEKPPEVEALIERATAMKGWLKVASECECATPEECALFPAPGEKGGTPTARSRSSAYWAPTADARLSDSPAVTETTSSTIRTLSSPRLSGVRGPGMLWT